MAKVKPFKAVRPTADRVGFVASRSYQTYSEAERNSRMEHNPYSFLHIINPGFKTERVLSRDERFNLVGQRYREFKKDGILKQDKKPGYYIYRIVNRFGKTFNGIVAAVSVEDYNEDVIKKHEATLAQRENIFKDYLKCVGFNAEPVLITYPDDEKLNEIIKNTQISSPEFDFTTTYKDAHKLWKVDDEERINAIRERFDLMTSLYIADGHHRSASSALLAKDLSVELTDKKASDSYGYFMAFLIPDTDLIIGAFHRLVKGLNGMTAEEFLEELNKRFEVTPNALGAFIPEVKGEFGMYLNGEFFRLALKTEDWKDASAFESLDTQILFRELLEPVLGISDLRTDSRIGYAAENKGIEFVTEHIDNGDFSVGFFMRPTSVDELKAIAEQHEIMPPKSTFILPKLRSGVTIYEF